MWDAQISAAEVVTEESLSWRWYLPQLEPLAASQPPAGIFIHTHNHPLPRDVHEVGCVGPRSPGFATGDGSGYTWRPQPVVVIAVCEARKADAYSKRTATLLQSAANSKISLHSGRRACSCLLALKPSCVVVPMSDCNAVNVAHSATRLRARVLCLRVVVMVVAGSVCHTVGWCVAVGECRCRARTM